MTDRGGGSIVGQNCMTSFLNAPLVNVTKTSLATKYKILKETNIYIHLVFFLFEKIEKYQPDSFSQVELLANRKQMCVRFEHGIFASLTNSFKSKCSKIIYQK